MQALLARHQHGRGITRGSPKDTNLRRETVIVESDFYWARLYLDSPSAVIRMPEDVPDNVECAYNRTVRIIRPYNNGNPSRVSTFEFFIDHNENTLDFSIDTGIKTSLDVGQSFSIQIVGAGKRIVRGHAFKILTDVELNTTGKKKAAEDSIIYRRVKDQANNNF